MLVEGHDAGRACAAAGGADRSFGPVTTGYSRLRIRRNVFSYKEQHCSGSDVSKTVDKRWPEYEFDTEGLRIELPASWAGPGERAEAIKAFAHILLALAPVVAACDPDDLEATSDQVGALPARGGARPRGVGALATPGHQDIRYLTL